MPIPSQAYGLAVELGRADFECLAIEGTREARTRVGGATRLRNQIMHHVAMHIG